MSLLTLPFDFVLWYVTRLPLVLLRFFLNANLALENQLAIRLHARLLFVPLFHDTTIVGRLLSIVFRLGRTIGGIFVLLATNVLMAPVLLGWVLAPFLPFFYRPAFLFWPFLVVFYVVAVFGKPKKRFSDQTAAADIPKVTSHAYQAMLAKLVKNPNSAIRTFAQSSLGRQFLFKLAIDPNGLVQKLNQTALRPIPNKAMLAQESLKLAHQAQAFQPDNVALFASFVALGSNNTFFSQFGVTASLVEKAYHWYVAQQRRNRVYHLWDEDYFAGTLGGVNRGWEGVPTPVLDSVGTDITKLALQHTLSPVVGRDNDIATIIQILSRAEHENVLLHGEPGCGKTSVIYKLAQQIVAGTVPKALFSKRVVSLDTGSLVAGANDHGGLEERMKTIIAEIEQTENVILVLDDVQNLFTASANQGEINLLELLKPYLSSTRFQVIAAASTENYQKYIEPLQDFVRLFQIVELSEVSADESIAILETEASLLEKKHGVVISLQAVIASVKLADRYIHDRVMPGKAFDLLDEACVMVASTYPGGVVSQRHVETIVEQKTHTPVHDVAKREKDVLLNLEAKLHNRMVGQEQAVLAVANALRRVRTQLNDSKRPIASFLFVGPTGVGKTELAKTLAEVYFGGEQTMARFDMSEFQEGQSIYRLLGTPPQTSTTMPQPGQLTEVVRKKPFALLLFDEIEKAHPSILDLFLQILDDGVLTDSSGHKVTFKDTIIIATSNAGTLEIEQSLGQGVPFQAIQESLIPTLTRVFRIEFLNRFDDIILFRPLTMDNMVAITRIMLHQLSKHLKQEGFYLDFSPELIAVLAKRGYNPFLGARPLRHLIQDEIESQIAKLILSEQLPKGKRIVLTPQTFQQQSAPM